MDLSGKTALVTGAGRGIGKGCALELARAGADLVLNDRPGSPDLAGTVSEIQSLGVACHAVEGDVFSRGGCEQLLSDTFAQVDALDIFISNPAASHRSTFLDFDPGEFERIVNATFVAGFHMSQLVARQWVERQQQGKIVFISSVQGERPYALSAAYGPAKAALNLLAQSIAVELAPHHINVNAIAPGWIDTPGEHDSFTKEQIIQEGARLPWGRLGQPEEIGRAAAFLASPDADYISGTVLQVDGLFRFRDCGTQF